MRALATMDKPTRGHATSTALLVNRSTTAPGRGTTPQEAKTTMTSNNTKKRARELMDERGIGYTEALRAASHERDTFAALGLNVPSTGPTIALLPDERKATMFDSAADPLIETAMHRGWDVHLISTRTVRPTSVMKSLEDTWAPGVVGYNTLAQITGTCDTFVTPTGDHEHGMRFDLLDGKCFAVESWLNWVAPDATPDLHLTQLFKHRDTNPSWAEMQYRLLDALTPVTKAATGTDAKQLVVLDYLGPIAAMCARINEDATWLASILRELATIPGVVTVATTASQNVLPEAIRDITTAATMSEGNLA